MYSAPLSELVALKALKESVMLGNVGRETWQG